MLSVVGRLQVRSWDDNEGKKRWSTDVVVEEQYFAESKGNGSKDNQDKKQQVQEATDGFYPIDDTIEDDDLPFYNKTKENIIKWVM